MLNLPMRKATTQGVRITPVTPKIRDTSFSDAMTCTGRTLSLARMYEEARKCKRLLQLVQNNVSVAWRGTQLHLKVHISGPNRDCPLSDLKILLLGREIIDGEQT